MFYYTIVSIVVVWIDLFPATSLNHSMDPDCPGWLCNITIEFGLLLNNNSVAFPPVQRIHYLDHHILL